MVCHLGNNAEAQIHNCILDVQFYYAGIVDFFGSTHGLSSFQTPTPTQTTIHVDVNGSTHRLKTQTFIDVDVNGITNPESRLQTNRLLKQQRRHSNGDSAHLRIQSCHWLT